MAYENECRLIEEFIDAVDELVNTVDKQAMAKDFFHDELERVRYKSSIASNEVYDIKMGNADEMKEALAEAKTARAHMNRAMMDLDDCIGALE